MDLATLLPMIFGGGLTAWNTFQTKQLQKLRAEINAQRAEIDGLTSWRLLAVGYIGTLLFLIAERGFKAPPPPEGLGLSVTVDTLPKGV